MRRHLLTRILSLFLTLAMGLSLPAVPAVAGPEPGQRTLRSMIDLAGLEEALKPQAAGLEEVQIEVPSSLRAAGIFEETEKVLDDFRLGGIPPADRFLISYILQEVLKDINEHGYGGKPEFRTTLTLRRLSPPDRIDVVVQDQAAQYQRGQGQTPMRFRFSEMSPPPKNSSEWGLIVEEHLRLRGREGGVFSRIIRGYLDEGRFKLEESFDPEVGNRYHFTFPLHFAQLNGESEVGAEPAGLEEPQATAAARPLPRQAEGLSSEVPVEVKIEPGEDLNGEILLGGRAVGGFEARIEGETLRLDSIFIGDSLSSSSPLQGQGIGAVAVRRILEEAIARGADRFESRVKNPRLLRILHGGQLLDHAETTVTDQKAHPPEPIPLNAFYDEYDVKNLPARYDSVDWIVAGLLASATGLEEEAAEATQLMLGLVDNPDIASTLPVMKEPDQVEADIGWVLDSVRARLQELGYQGNAWLLSPARLPGAAGLAAAKTVYIKPGEEWSDDVREQLEPHQARGNYTLVTDPSSAGVVVGDRATRVLPTQAVIRVDSAEAARQVTFALLSHLDGKGLLDPGSIVFLHKGDLDEDVYLFA